MDGRDLKVERQRQSLTYHRFGLTARLSGLFLGKELMYAQDSSFPRMSPEITVSFSLGLVHEESIFPVALIRVLLIDGLSSATGKR